MLQQGDRPSLNPSQRHRITTKQTDILTDILTYTLTRPSTPPTEAPLTPITNYWDTAIYVMFIITILLLTVIK